MQRHIFLDLLTTQSLQPVLEKLKTYSQANRNRMPTLLDLCIALHIGILSTYFRLTPHPSDKILTSNDKSYQLIKRFLSTRYPILKETIFSELNIRKLITELVTIELKPFLTGAAHTEASA